MVPTFLSHILSLNHPKDQHAVFAVDIPSSCCVPKMASNYSQGSRGVRGSSLQETAPEFPMSEGIRSRPVRPEPAPKRKRGQYTNLAWYFSPTPRSEYPHANCNILVATNASSAKPNATAHILVVNAPRAARDVGLLHSCSLQATHLYQAYFLHMYLVAEERRCEFCVPRFQFWAEHCSYPQ